MHCRETLFAVTAILIYSAAGQGSCGQPTISPMSSRVVGGEEATPGSWPWQVLLTSSSAGTSSQFCGGSLLNDRWVLTAAHCVDTGSEGSLYIKLGAHNRYSTTEGAVVSGVSTIIRHPSYNSRIISYDYALVELDQSITFTDKISPVCLPTSGDNVVGSLVTTTGWGALTETGSSPDLLQQVNLKLYSDADCSKKRRGRSGSSLRRFYDSRSMMCAGVDAGGKGSCYGDSGGPLVIYREGEYKLIGVVSWGVGCARKDLPTVYAKVSTVLSWINGYIG